MPVVISMLRGVNLGPHNRIKMEVLRSVYEKAECEDPRTYVQSGNVIFRTGEKNSAKLAVKIQKAINDEFGFRPDVILRSTKELKAAISANPFAKRANLEPGKLLVTFLADEPSRDAQAMLRDLKTQGEELHLKGRELYIYFPDGAGRSKLPWSSLAKLMKTTGTARNWNSVVAMLEIAEKLEGCEKK